MILKKHLTLYQNKEQFLILKIYYETLMH